MMNRAKINQQLSLAIPFHLIRASALAYDHHGLNGQDGIDLLSRQRGYPKSCLRSVEEHLGILRNRGAIGNGTVITQTMRNAFQNPRSPLYSAEHGICQSKSEQVHLSRRSYRGIAALKQGGFRAVSIDFRKPVDGDISYLVTGIPVLWGGRTLDVAEMLPEVGDFCHLYRLNTSETRGSVPEDVERYRSLRQCYNQVLHAPAQDASQALCDAARGLARESDYLHNAVGVGRNHLILVMAHGSLEEIGQLLLDAGATEGIVVDNGGSCQIAVERPGQPLRPVAESHYFRPPSIAIAAYELDGADQHDILIEGTSGLLSRKPAPSLAASGSSPVVDVDLITHLTPPGSTLLHVVQSDLAAFSDGSSTEVWFDDPTGITRERLAMPSIQAAPALGECFTHAAAAFIQNHAVLLGTRRVWINAGIDYVNQIGKVFSGRFDKINNAHPFWSECVSSYLSLYTGQPFEILCGRPADPDSRACPSAMTPPSKSPSDPGPVIGVDIGSQTTKAVAMVGGQVRGQLAWPTRNEHGRYDTVFFRDQLRKHVSQLAGMAQIDLDSIERCGIAWCGAVRDHRIVCPSNTARDLADIHEQLDSFCDMPEFFRKAAGLRGNTLVRLINDGNCLAYAGAVSGQRGVLYLGLGTSVAGGFVDSEGRWDFLTEFGRVCVDLSLRAAAHPHTKITGLARQLIPTSTALKRLLDDDGFESYLGEAITRKNVGKIANLALGSGKPDEKKAVDRALAILGANLAHLLATLRVHLPFHTVRLAGAILTPGTEVTKVIKEHCAATWRMPTVGHQATQILVEEDPQFAGAMAAASFAQS